MSIKLIAESGSTKTDWVLIGASKRPIRYKTQGINPYLQTPEDVLTVLQNELKIKKYQPEQVFFYGAGISDKKKTAELKKVLQTFFNTKKVKVKSDIVAAARGLCNNEKGVVAILGTGSNSCYYNGKTIKTGTPSLGYVLGDEGSGNHMGKRVLRYYAYKTFDTELMEAFEYKYGNDLNAMLHNIYKEPFPNRYMATFAPFLADNRGHYMVENILEDSLSEFFDNHIQKYRECWKYPIYFTGSIAYEFRDLIKRICTNANLTVGKIEKSPLKGLIKYHQQ